MCWYRTLGLENRSDKNRPLLETLPLHLNIPKSHPEKNPGDQKNADWLQRTHWNLPFQTSSANYKGKDMANKNRHVESTNSIFFQGLRINWEPPERGVWICFLQGSFRSPNRYWDPIILRAFLGMWNVAWISKSSLYCKWRHCNQYLVPSMLMEPIILWCQRGAEKMFAMHSSISCRHVPNKWPKM